jgi:hypothetical protein
MGVMDGADADGSASAEEAMADGEASPVAQAAEADARRSTIAEERPTDRINAKFRPKNRVFAISKDEVRLEQAPDRASAREG